MSQLHVFVILVVNCEVCVDGGWSKQPHLARVRQIRLWGLVRLQPGVGWATDAQQVQPVITHHPGECSG